MCKRLGTVITIRTFLSTNQFHPSHPSSQIFEFLKRAFVSLPFDSSRKCPDEKRHLGNIGIDFRLTKHLPPPPFYQPSPHLPSSSWIQILHKQYRRPAPCRRKRRREGIVGGMGMGREPGRQFNFMWEQRFLNTPVKVSFASTPCLECLRRENESIILLFYFYWCVRLSLMPATSCSRQGLSMSKRTH